ncbi:hypothetical protein BEL01nite_84190 [Bradyrhizobium elkanii]|nr:hypothetical protein BEL01nite_84190 [Bradyrhizobium elkanii]
MAAAQLPRNPLQSQPHALRRNTSATSSGVFITCPPWINPRGAFRDSFLVHSLSPQLSKKGQLLVTLRGHDLLPLSVIKS